MGKTAIAQVGLPSMKFALTPEEHQILGLTEDDVASFSEVTPPEVLDGVKDIIAQAYESAPVFKKLVDEDAARDPSRLGRSSKVVAKFLKHLRSSLPPDSASMIHGDTFLQAHEIVQAVLSGQVQGPVAPGVVPEEKIDPITDAELSLFNLPRAILTDRTTWSDIKDGVLFFLGRLRGPDGKAVKNEATKDMPDETKIAVLSKLFYDIRVKKLEASGGKLSPSAEHLVGRDVGQLKQMAKSMVVRGPGKPDPVYQNDLMEVNSQVGESLKMIDRIQSISKDTKFTEAITDMTQVLDTALPPVSLFEDRIKSIQEEISKLGLSKVQASALLSVDPGSLSYIDPLTSVGKVLEDQKVALQAVHKEIADKGSSPELDLKVKTLEGQIKQLEGLSGSGKDMSGLKGAVEDYLSTLRTYKESIKKNITDKKMDESHQRTMADFSRMVDLMALTFSRLTREELFKARWAGRSGFLMRGDKPAAPVAPEAEVAPVAPVAPVSKMAAEDAEKPAGYAAKVQAFRGSGLGDAYREIQDIIESDDKLPAIKGKLIKILGLQDRIEEVGAVFDSGKDPQQIKQEVLGLTQGTVYGSQIADILSKSDDLGKLKSVIISMLKKDQSVMSQSTGVSSVDISMDDAMKLVSRLRSLIKKIKIVDKGTEAMEVIEWAADLPRHIKLSKPKSKLASLSYRIRKFAMDLIGAEEKDKGIHKTYQSPAGTGSDRPLRSPGKARPILFRERITKMGKKALQSVFDEPTFVPDFVEEMEKAGLSRMMMHGSEMKEMDIEPILESVLKKVTGKTGDLENILSSKTMQAFRSEYDIGKAKRELEESRARVKDLNAKISEVEDKYLPKLEEFAVFIKDPIAVTREQIEELKGSRDKDKRGDKVERKEQDKIEEIKPEAIDSRSYRSVLRRLADKYIPKGGVSTKTDFSEQMFKQAKVDTEEKSNGNVPVRHIKALPTEFIKQYMVWKKQLKNAKVGVDRMVDPYKRAVELEKYYAFMLTVVQGIAEYFDYHGKILKADAATIQHLEEFLGSDAAKDEKEQFIQESKVLLAKLKGSFDRQVKALDSLKRVHSDIDSVRFTVEDQLDALREDISDKKVDMVYQIAVSPELVPNKEKAREIRERAKEHEKGLSFIIDRSTYKNNMNKLMMLKPTPKQVVSYPGEGVKVLPPERKKDLEITLKNFEERARQMSELAESGMREIAFKKMEDDLARAKTDVVVGMKRIEDYTALIENIDFLAANKETLDPAEYKAQVDAVNAILKTLHIYKDDSSQDIKADKRGLKEDIEKEKEYLDRIKAHIGQIEGGLLEKARKEFESKRPPVDVPRQVDLLTQKLYRLRLMDQQSTNKPFIPIEQLKVMEEKVKQIEELGKVPVEVTPGTPGAVAYKKFKDELDRSLSVAKRDLEEFKKKSMGDGQPGIVKTAAIEDTMPDLSPYEKALETKGIKPAPFMQELPKPKGWDIVENFFSEVKREHNFLKGMKEEGKQSPLQSKYLKKRLDQLENMAEAIDMYKNTKVTIGGDPVAFREVMLKFEDTLSEYQDLLAKYTNQRDDATNKVAYLQQELDHYNELYDPETGEFKGLDPEEVANLKGIFLRMLYKDLERYWATRVGKDLSVFGERDTNWYNNVFMTFKDVAKARSNKKMLGLLNKYKQETRSDFDDMVNRMKSQQLEKERDTLLEGYTELGVDPSISSRLKDFDTRIETLKKQEKQMDRIFNFMGTASLVAMQADFEKKMRERVQELAATAKSDEPLKESKADLNKKAEEKVDEAIKAVEEELPVIAEHDKEVALAEQDLAALRSAMGQERDPVPESSPVETPAAPSVSKMAFDKTHPDFNLNILYGSHMQSKIAEMMSQQQ